MSALAQNVECSRTRDSKRTSRCSEHRTLSVDPAAERETELSLSVSRCCTTIPKCTHFKANLRGSKERRFLKAFHIGHALMVLTLFASIAESMNRADDRAGDALSLQQYRSADSRAGGPGAKMDVTEAVIKTFFGDWSSRLKTLLVVIAFTLAMTAMFMDMTGIHHEMGKHLFGDQGASMWLRLAIVIPGLVFAIGGSVIAYNRVRQRTEMSEKDYEQWRDGPREGVMMKHFGKNSSYKLLMCYFVGIVVLGIVFSIAGGIKNGDNAMLWGTVAALIGVGTFGLIGAVCTWKFGVCHQEKTEAATRQTSSNGHSQLQRSKTVYDPENTRRRLEELLKHL